MLKTADLHSKDTNCVTPGQSLRKDFPILDRTMNGRRLAYLDSAASAQKPRAVLDAMNSVYSGSYANIHRGLYEFSQKTTRQFEEVREKIARFINVKSEKEIVFTRNTTEAINIVASCWGAENLGRDDEIILTRMEHHANIVPWQILQKKKGFAIKIWEVRDDGSLNPDDLQTLLSGRTKMLGLVHISNALGTVNPVAEIIQTVKAYNPDITVVIDGTQAVVHGPVDMRETGCDFFAFTGHKLYGPTGVGVLYGRYDHLQAMPPYQGGGDMIEEVRFEETTFKDAPYKFEAGTPSFVDVIGLGAAIDYLSAAGMDTIRDYEAGLLAYATAGLSDIDGLKLYGTAENKAAILSFTIEGCPISDLGMLLDRQGVAVRSGHHCCMPLMQAMGVEGTTRASIGLYTVKEDIDQLTEALIKARDMLQ